MRLLGRGRNVEETSSQPKRKRNTMLNFIQPKVQINSLGLSHTLHISANFIGQIIETSVNVCPYMRRGFVWVDSSLNVITDDEVMPLGWLSVSEDLAGLQEEFCFSVGLEI